MLKTERLCQTFIETPFTYWVCNQWGMYRIISISLIHEWTRIACLEQLVPHKKKKRRQSISKMEDQTRRSLRSKQRVKHPIKCHLINMPYSSIIIKRSVMKPGWIHRGRCLREREREMLGIVWALAASLIMAVSTTNCMIAFFKKWLISPRCHLIGWRDVSYYSFLFGDIAF